MAGLGDTLLNLAQFRTAHGAWSSAAAPASRLVELDRFGSNPGGLRMLCHVPDGLAPGAPLVVVLHGCAQTAAAYDTGAGWSTLADRHGFAVLYPEQTRANNANLCFNWFQPEDAQRESGEAASIHQGVARMVVLHHSNPARVFVTGLSAGGAMAAALLAAYPEAFAGGALIAGMPYGSAGSMHGAFEVMFQGRSRTAAQWGNLVRSASSHAGPWPRVQVWQGSADSTVTPSNANELTKQWADVHGVEATKPDVSDTVDGAAHQAWRGRDGHVMLESYRVPGLAHGTPLDTQHADPDHAAGHAGPHMLEGGISSTWHIAQSWGLLASAPP